MFYFLLTVKEEGLNQDADCWTVLIASLLVFWRGCLGIGSLRADTLNMLKETGGGERDFLAAYSNWEVLLATSCCWKWVCSIWRVCVLETRRPELTPSSVLGPSCAMLMKGLQKMQSRKLPHKFHFLWPTIQTCFLPAGWLRALHYNSGDHSGRSRLQLPAWCFTLAVFSTTEPLGVAKYPQRPKVLG